MIIIKSPPNPSSASPPYFGEEQCFESSNNEEVPITLTDIEVLL